MSKVITSKQFFTQLQCYRQRNEILHLSEFLGEGLKHLIYSIYGAYDKSCALRRSLIFLFIIDQLQKKATPHRTDLELLGGSQKTDQEYLR